MSAQDLKRWFRWALLAGVWLLSPSLLTLATDTNDLEFLEAFVWKDRDAALKRLVPNTEDYFFFHCLHYQHIGDRKAFWDTLEKWRAFNRGYWNDRMRELQRRQKLIEGAEDPTVVWGFLAENATFGHVPRRPLDPERLPSEIRPETYTTEAFLARVDPRRLPDEFSPRGLRWAFKPDLNPEHRRLILARLLLPDYPDLVHLILADLDYRDPQGRTVQFGDHPIHRRLTSAQLEELGRRRPALLTDELYVNERLARIVPPEADLSYDHEAAVRYYRQLWAFVSQLGPVHNSLKASTLYRLLDHQRRLGLYDATLFHAYLELPRPVPYVPLERRRTLERRRAVWADLNYRPNAPVILPPIGNDESLVREYLIELLKDAPDPSTFAELLESRWLNALFAESKILHGVGRPEEWASWLTPEAYRAILERVELHLAPQNASYLRLGQPVELIVDVKRIDEVRVKLFEIQTFNYYTTRRAPVDQAVDLDGLMPTREWVVRTAADPGRRVRHTIPIPDIPRRGVYVVELIGGGLSSRAVLHVGRLEAVAMPTATAQAVMVFNEAGEVVKNAALWVDRREFTAEENGLILLPYSEKAGTRFAVLRDGDFCSPESLQHLDEQYQFSAGIHLDPQNLPRRTSATLILRPDFRIHGIPLDPRHLGAVKVMLAAVDAKGIRTEREYEATFERNIEWSRTFYVPDEIRQLEVRVQAKIRRKSDGQEITLSDSRSIALNQGRAADVRQQIFLMPSQDGWRLEVRGLAGEPIAGVPLDLFLRRNDIRTTVAARLGTDAAGRVRLGPLDGVTSLEVRGPDGLQLRREVEGGVAMLPARIHARRGETISLPYPWDRVSGLPPASLFQMRGEIFLADLTEAVSIADGEVRIADLPVGEYRLYLHEPEATVSIDVVDAPARAGFLFDTTRRLQQTPTRLPSIAGVEVAGEEAIIRLRHPTISTRLAVRAYRYKDDGSGFPAGLGFPAPLSRTIYPLHAQYLSGRRLGDEYRYVIERRNRGVFAGTLLERPGLILNPWEIRETSAERERLQVGEAYRRATARMAGAYGGVADPSPDRAGRGRPLPEDETSRHIGYDFLPQGSRWWTNLKPDRDGVVRLPLADLDGQTALDLVVLDTFGTLRTRLLLPDRDIQPRDTRLLAGLKPDGQFSRQKKIQVLQPGESVQFPDLATTQYQTIRTVGQVFDLLQTLSGDSAVLDFAFLKRWDKLDEAEKLKKYGEYACHELHLFLYERDRPFFDRVVRPYLANKKDKTFVDRWLLDALTPEDVRVDKLQQRNALELALLARRGGDAPAIRAMLREAWELLPPDPEGFARRVRTALLAGELDETVAAARQAARNEAEKASRVLRGLATGRAMAEGRDADIAEMSAEMRRVAAPAPAAAAASPPLPAADRDVSFALKEAELQKDEGPADDEAILVGEAVEGVAPERLYRALPKTKEWAEQNYYNVRAKDDTPARVPVSGFWLDVAAGAPVPERLLEAHRSLTEVLAGVTFCGLPWETEPPEAKQDGAQLTLTVRSPALLVTEQILPANLSADDRPLLISQQFFRPDDLYRYEGNEKVEKFIAGEFVRRVVYGGRITVTNPTASPRRLSVLWQIPLGAVPLRNSIATDERDLLLPPYTTQTIEYFFAFPFAGAFPHFPAHAADRETVVGRAEPRVFRVVDEPTEVDKTSWAWVSQYASDEETLAFMRAANLRRLDLKEIAWRLQKRDFFEQVCDLLVSRGVYHDVTFSYAVYHKDLERARIWLAGGPIARGVGPAFESPFLRVDPVENRIYEHLEYDPLVNPRAHPIGEKLRILNTALNEQYRAFLRVSLYRPELNAHERLALVYYLLLQDRLDEAVAELQRVRDGDLHERMQADYLRAWLALRQLDIVRATELAKPYLNHPVPRWRARFRALADAIAEARGAAPAEVAEPSRQQEMDRRAAEAPTVELQVEGGRLWLTAHRLKNVTLNLYPIDIEILFSKQPFLVEGGADFAVVRPAWTREIAVKGDGEREELVLPREFTGRNLMVEVVGRGQRAAAPWFASRLRVRKMESFGQVEVRSAADGKPVPKTYIKVFARGADGQISFWKDGYTDLRGRFDYLSLNDREPEEAVEFAILILHPELGAEVRTARPPLR